MSHIRPAMNGFKSQLTGLTTVMTEEDRLAQSDFAREYIRDLAPIGAVERQFARSLASDNWRLNRIKTVEENIFAWGNEAKTGPNVTCEIPQVEAALTHPLSYLKHSKPSNDISLCESRLTRIIGCNMDLLLKLQYRRQQRVRQTEPAEVAKIRTHTAAAGAATASAANPGQEVTLPQSA